MVSMNALRKTDNMQPTSDVFQQPTRGIEIPIVSAFAFFVFSLLWSFPSLQWVGAVFGEHAERSCRFLYIGPAEMPRLNR